eukprot:Sspe_Gene.21468::Locus_8058_Transcript_1_1_Confidence_1.000_Length_2605::g.21468::m.21468/K08864/TLK; tousled-like kinase
MAADVSAPHTASADGHAAERDVPKPLQQQPVPGSPAKDEAPGTPQAECTHPEDGSSRKKKRIVPKHLPISNWTVPRKPFHPVVQCSGGLAMHTAKRGIWDDDELQYSVHTEESTETSTFTGSAHDSRTAPDRKELRTPSKSPSTPVETPSLPSPLRGESPSVLKADLPPPESTSAPRALPLSPRTAPARNSREPLKDTVSACIRILAAAPESRAQECGIPVAFARECQAVVQEHQALTRAHHQADHVEQANCNTIAVLASREKALTELAAEALIETTKRQRKRFREEAARESCSLGHVEAKAFGEVFVEGHRFLAVRGAMTRIDERRKELEASINSRTKRLAAADGTEPAVSDDSYTEPEFVQDGAERLELQHLRKEHMEQAKVLAKLETEKVVATKEWKRIRDEDASRFKGFPLLGGRYRMVGLLGKGGFSEVWKALDMKEGQIVAVKVHQLKDDWPHERKEDYMRHARRECRIQQGLRHPNVVRLLNYFTVEEGSFATVLEYTPLDDLDTYLKQHHSLKERDARAILLQIVSALHYLHTQPERVIHYDLKPGNILFFSDLHIKITDFGLSKQMSSDIPDEVGIELTSQGAGTFWYLPPECFEYKLGGSPRVSPKVDVWSAGVVFFQMLYGRKPFGNNVSQHAVMKDGIITNNAHHIDWPSQPKISKGAMDILRRMLSYNAADRPTVESLLHDPYFAEDFGADDVVSISASDPCTPLKH